MTAAAATVAAAAAASSSSSSSTENCFSFVFIVWRSEGGRGERGSRN